MEFELPAFSHATKQKHPPALVLMVVAPTDATRFQASIANS
jgi:hypothetical protein